ncbi:MAG: DUF4369 domain-containing protein, partial [Alistipes sp.]|nr:DUF4369 domain-containing protein [Alistipes sp.]
MSYNLRPLLRSLLVGLSLLLGLSTCRPTPPAATGYTVDGEITGIAGWVYLTLFEGEAPRRIDSAAVVNGAFHFTGEQ